MVTDLLDIQTRFLNLHFSIQNASDIRGGGLPSPLNNRIS